MLYHLSTLICLFCMLAYICCVKYVKFDCLMYRPEVESKSMRFKMMTEHKSVIGQSRAFDGAILYLPILITEKVSDA